MNSVAGFAIRDAQAADTPVLTRIVRTSGAYDGAYRVLVAPLTIDAAYIADNSTRVCIDDEGTIVGFASLVVPGRGVAGEAELDYMFVVDDRQGRGLGRALIADIVAVGRELGIERIHIVSHPPAEAFYRSVGAVRVGEIPSAGRISWSRPWLQLDITVSGTAR